ncbi:MAG TPA: exopolysaccharide biosynthesis polyprenyl glycosylphosphotransferase [Caulobacteraceae bacterium]|nr:exopolysaccharide biosynthesis polyprenyl glycosylphosphotransferase [Caulobacteraceae bacterium]
MTAHLARPLQSDRSSEFASEGDLASGVDNPPETSDPSQSPARARQALVAEYAAEQSVSKGPIEGHKRGALRPAQLITTRARHEAAAVERLFRTADGAAALGLAVLAAALAHPEGLLKASVGSVLPLAAAIVSLLWRLRLARSSRFAHRQSLASTLARVASALLGSAVAAALVIAAVRPPAADVLATETWFVLSAVALGVSEAAWWRRLTQWRASGRLTPNIVVVGATENARKLIEKAREGGKLAVLGIFDDRLGRAPSDVAGVPVLGDTRALLGHRIMPYVDRVVITVPPHAQGRVRQLIEKLKVLPNEVSLFLDFEGEDAQSAAVSRLAEAPLARVSGLGPDDGRVLAKRLQDLALGALAMILAAPIMGIVAIAIRLDSPGPILFRQRRHGFNNEEIVVWKFRSMRHESADPTASRQVVADDDRVTRVGRFIRKFSLDELPQLVNVLKGEMSLVGPRPHAIGMKTGEVESAKLVGEYAWRHRMKPGVTGWAAVRGSRGPVHTPAEVRRRVELDVEYIERQSLWLDLYILAMTIPCLLLGDREAVR